MSYSIIPTPRFKKSAKAMVKRYFSLKAELRELETVLQNNPDFGTSLGNNCFKIRLAIKSKQKGKSGGARVITYVVANDKEIFLIDIYDKSVISTVDDKTLRKLIEEIRRENR